MSKTVEATKHAGKSATKASVKATEAPADAPAKEAQEKAPAKKAAAPKAASKPAPPKAPPKPSAAKVPSPKAPAAKAPASKATPIKSTAGKELQIRDIASKGSFTKNQPKVSPSTRPGNSRFMPEKHEPAPSERVFERVPGSLVQGPIETRRFGRTLIIDMSTPQVAMTAKRGMSIPRASLIVTTAAREIISLAREAVKVDTIAIVGTEMDPTGHPNLREITENLRALRDKHLSRSKLRVFTSARDISSYDLRATLAMYDRVHLQLDWGTPKVFAAVTGQKQTQFTPFIKNASNFDHLIVEASFYKGADDIDNSSEAEVTQWLKRLQEVKPQEVHILAGCGSAAKLPKIKAVTKARRDEIAELVAESTGLNVTVYEEEAQLV